VLSRPYFLLRAAYDGVIKRVACGLLRLLPLLPSPQASVLSVPGSGANALCRADATAGSLS